MRPRRVAASHAMAAAPQDEADAWVSDVSSDEARGPAATPTSGSGLLRRRADSSGGACTPPTTSSTHHAEREVEMMERSIESRGASPAVRGVT